MQRIADRMSLSPSTLYKWAESKDTGSASGIPNPLDRALDLYRATGDPRIIRWLCEQAGGFFVENVKDGEVESAPIRLAPATSKVVKQFADLLSTVAGAASDSKINLAEARRIRKEWENLKRVAEGYVKYCEDGNFKRLKSDLSKLK